MWGIRAVALVLMLGWSSNAVGQEAGDIAEANRRIAEAQRREWVKNQLTKLIADPKDRAEVLERVKDLPDEQIQIIASICLDELESRRRTQLKALREANRRERAFEEELRQHIPPVPIQPGYFPPLEPGYYPPIQPGYYSPEFGYIPVITWLPEGASLQAQAVVSPDGRRVRMSLVPFFSTIGPVYTFNYMTGETRRYDP